MGVMGMYSWAEELLSQIKSETLTPELLGYYYRTVRANYGWFADYLINKDLKELIILVYQTLFCIIITSF